ncbi:MAG: hypothetical protein M1816_005976 [Peltula sp. TS41687]|nr:MAG: hypothetical protein M1816_005976 [Peltula sp. TS41687]
MRLHILLIELELLFFTIIQSAPTQPGAQKTNNGLKDGTPTNDNVKLQSIDAAPAPEVHPPRPPSGPSMPVWEDPEMFLEDETLNPMAPGWPVEAWIGNRAKLAKEADTSEASCWLDFREGFKSKMEFLADFPSLIKCLQKLQEDGEIVQLTPAMRVQVQYEVNLKFGECILKGTPEGECRQEWTMLEGEEAIRPTLTPGVKALLKKELRKKYVECRKFEADDNVFSFDKGLSKDVCQKKNTRTVDGEEIVPEKGFWFELPSVVSNSLQRMSTNALNAAGRVVQNVHPAAGFGGARLPVSPPVLVSPGRI